MEIEQIIDTICNFIDNIENFSKESKERDIAVTKLKEAVFWLTYLYNRK